MKEAVSAADIGRQVFDAVSFLCREAALVPDALLVLGCSTSEITGGQIGKAGSPEIGKVVVRAARDACDAADVRLAVQCCEHLNRALVMPRETAFTRGYAQVNAVPYPHAGGSAAAAAYRLFTDPVLVEGVQADAALDIGDTLIGMHMKPVAVPLRYQAGSIGQAHLTMAYTRPKYIGGPRTKYALEDPVDQND